MNLSDAGDDEDPTQQLLETNRFRIDRRLGSGSFGAVYAAFDEERNQEVALKVLHDISGESILRFKNEFRSLAGLRHRNLVQLYELLTDGKSWFYTMELIDGIELLEYLALQEMERTLPDRGVPTLRLSRLGEEASQSSVVVKSQNYALPQALTPTYFRDVRVAMRQLVEGMSAIHAAGKLHRDIKPSNIAVTSEGRLVLLDFGLVLEAHLGGPAEGAWIVGTPGYMSPEQTRGLPVTDATDWYSLGVVLFQALTGSLPFAGDLREILKKQDSETVEFPEHLLEAVPGDLRDVCVKLLHKQPDKRPKGEEVRRCFGSRGFDVWLPSFRSSPAGSLRRLAGREDHIEKLHELFREVEKGEFRGALVHGTSGTGKTTLVRHFLSSIEEKGGSLVLSGACHEFEQVPYNALDQIIDSLSRYLARLPSSERAELLPPDSGLLSEIFPVLREALDNLPDLNESRGTNQVRKAFTVLRAILTRIASRKPLVLFVDDVQWGDYESAAAYRLLLSVPFPALIIFSYTTEDAPTSLFLRNLAAVQTADWADIQLDTLTQEEAEQLAALVLERVNLAPHVIDRLISESGGNAFLLWEVLQYGKERWLTSGEETFNLLDLFQSRLAALPKEARWLLQVIAVAGQPLPANLALEAAGLEQGQRDLFSLLRQARLVRSRLTGGIEEIEAYHQQIREIVRAQMSAESTRRIHLSLADSMESSGVADPESLAEHYEASSEPLRAFDYYIRGAEDANRAESFGKAVRLYRHAREIAPTRWDSHHSTAYAAALIKGGFSFEASRLLQEEASRAAAGSAENLNERAAEHLIRSGRVREGLKLLKPVLDKFASSPSENRVTLTAQLLLERLRLKAQRAVSWKVKSAAGDTAGLDTLWTAASGLALIDPLRAIYVHTRHLRLALARSEPRPIARAFAMEAGFLSGRSGTRESRVTKLLSAATSLADEVEDDYVHGMVNFASSVYAMNYGRWRQALHFADRAEQSYLAEGSSLPWELDSTRWFALRALYYLGDLRQLRSRCAPLIEDAEARNDLFASTNLKLRASYTGALMADHPAEAREEVRLGMAAWPNTEFDVQHWLALLAEVEIFLYEGAGMEAWELVAQKWTTLESSSLLRNRIVRTVSLALRGRAALAAAHCSPETAATEGLVKDALKTARQLQKEGLVWTAGLASALLAAIDAREGALDKALRNARLAERAFLEADMKLFVHSTRYRIGQWLANDHGTQMTNESRAAFAAEDVTNSKAMIRMIIPGPC